MKKLFKIILCMAIILSNFSPLLTVKVKAATNFTVVIAKPIAANDVLHGSYETYAEALAAMLAYPSTDQAVAVIKNSSGRIINAEYATAEVDYINSNKILTSSDEIKYLYSTPADAVSGSPNPANYLAPIAATWGVDSTFLDYDDTYQAVKVKISGVTGWLALWDVGIIPISRYYGDSVSVNYPGNNGTFKNDTYYYVIGNVLYHQIHMGTASPESTTILGDAPYYYDGSGKHWILSNTASGGTGASIRYYSFDSKYFYTSYAVMVDDYKNGVYTNAINASYPYYSYFLYLPSHAKTNYVAGTFDNMLTAANYTAFPTNPTSYVNPATGAFFSGSAPAGLSMMYGIGTTLVNVANTYGANALTLYSVAKVESGMGTSSIAFYKYNLYGMGAGDDNPFGNATSYLNIYDSVVDYTRKIGQTSYASIFDYRYSGTHLGSKLSGQMVYYATDPYSGEAKAGSAFSVDNSNGRIDNNANTLGVTKSTTSTTKIYSEPNSASRVIYETKNYSNNKVLTDMPFIVTDKISVIEGGQPATYYKVYTDVSLTDTRILTSDINIMYNFDNCYGYIKASDLYVSNNQPTITASNRTVTQFNTVDLLTGVTATDLESGSLTSKIVVDKGTYDINVPGQYAVTYTATDASKYSVSKTITITVEPSNQPTIVAEDITIPQIKAFNNMTGVSVIVKDVADTELLTDVIVTGTVDVTTIGEYTLNYTVTDEEGLTDTETRKVTVIANEKPVLKYNISVLTAYIGQVYDCKNGFTAIDKEDGDVTNTLNCSGIVNTEIEGQYDVEYSTTDLDGQIFTTTLTITVEKPYIASASMFYLSNLTYNSTTSKVDFTGYLTIKGINNTAATEIAYDIIFENQKNGNKTIKSLSRLTSNVPFAVPNSGGFDYSGSWFKESLDLTDLVSGDYTVYVRARSGDYESKVLLKNEYFNTNVERKFAINTAGYQFRINYYNRSLPLELFVRNNGLISGVNNPTVDNMYNQVYSISLDGTTLNLTASSHNVKGDYASNKTVERYVVFENIDTLEIAKTVNVGSITNGPYKVNLKVSDGYDKTKVWYNTSIDLSTLPKGTYSVLIRTKTGTIDDYGELYDILYMTSIDQSKTVNEKKITIKRNNDRRYRIEITVE